MTKSMPIKGWRSFSRRNLDQPRSHGATVTITVRTSRATSSDSPPTNCPILKSTASIYFLDRTTKESMPICIPKASKPQERQPTISQHAMRSCSQRKVLRASSARSTPLKRPCRRRQMSTITSWQTNVRSLQIVLNHDGLPLLIWANNLKISNQIQTTCLKKH